MGLRPIPHLGSFFGKKLPKNPKKPDWIGFRISSKDNEQGCLWQPCFVFSENCSYSFSDEVKKQKACSFNKIAAERNKASSSLRACFCCPAGQCSSLMQEKLQSCLKVTLKSIRRISRAWSSRFAVQLTGTKRGGEDRFLRKERRETPASPLGCR